MAFLQHAAETGGVDQLKADVSDEEALSSLLHLTTDSGQTGAEEAFKNIPAEL